MTEKTESEKTEPVVATSKKAPKKASKKATKKTSKKATSKKVKEVKNEVGKHANIKYIYDEFGFIDWRKMIPSKFLVVNQDYFNAINKDAPKETEGLADKEVIILLSGLKWLARVNGYKSIDYEPWKIEEGYSAVKCTIDWGDDKPTTSDVASATDFNCDGFGKTFLEAICANRAFSRCVRNYLNIHVVSDEERGPLKPDDDSDIDEKAPEQKKVKKASHASIVPQEFFVQSAKDVLGNLESVIWFLNENGIKIPDDADEKVIVGLLDVKSCRKLIKKLNESKKT